ncbi:MAG: hypothetical protein IPG99_19380 [Ignavibacteria bacterium]|nr:hypothetical protein [Ignavibacteria bacterium]
MLQAAAIVYDVLGHEMSTPENTKQAPGVYQVEFDANFGGVWFISAKLL